MILSASASNETCIIPDTCSIVIDIKGRPPPFITVQCTNIYIYILIRSTREEPIVSPREQCSFETFELLKTDGWLCLVCTTTAKFFISPDRNFVFFSFLLLSSLRFNLRRLVTTRRVTTTNDFPPFLFVFNDRRVEFSSSFRESLEFWYSSSFVYPKKLWDSENCSIKFLIPAQKSNRVRY